MIKEIEPTKKGFDKYVIRHKKLSKISSIICSIFLILLIFKIITIGDPNSGLSQGLSVLIVLVTISLFIFLNNYLFEKSALLSMYKRSCTENKIVYKNKKSFEKELNNLK